MPIEDVVSPAGLARRFHTWEPSDWLLFRDSRTATAQPLDIGAIASALEDGPRTVRHLVAPAGTSAGTTERLVFDGEGRVVRIQRYYERVTWSFAAGVACSLVPVASLQGTRDLHVASLNELRASLASSGVPSHDFFTQVEAFDLRRETGFLSLTERVLQPSLGRSGEPVLARSAVVHETALLHGAVVVAEDAVVEARVVVVGPTVVGRGCRIGTGSVLAQSVVAPGTQVPPEAVARQRVVTEAQVAMGVLTDDASGRGEHLAPAPALEVVDPTNPFEPFLFLKAPVERVVALLSLALLSPLLAVIAAAVRLTSRGPAFYGDVREGRDAKEFRCWKFRTMYADAAALQRELAEDNEVDGPQFKMRSDPRVTPVGHWLRRLNLDELPQLVNVARGEMSFVGPRPSPFRENQICVPWRDARLSVAPGITGLWQICRDRSVTADFHQWIHYDLLYVRHASPWLDFKILLATVLTLGGRWPVPLRRLIRRPPTTLQPSEPAPTSRPRPSRSAQRAA